MTDYSDAVMFPGGIVMIALLAMHPNRVRSVAMAGILAGVIVVANPFSLTVVVSAAPFWLARVPRRRWAALVGVGTAAAAFVVLFGLVLFRERYGISNIYAPTVDFIRANNNYADPLKSPRLWWMGYRLWIYLPPLIIGIYHVLRRRYRFQFDPAERAIVSTCTLQYIIQVWYQFSRHGSTLEISYYWSYIMPAFALTFCVVVGAFFRQSRSWYLPGIAVVAVVAAGLNSKATPEVFQSWLDALAVLLVGAYLARRVVTSRPEIVGAGLVVVALLAQTSSPRPEPTLAGELRVLSSYELAYVQKSDGVQSFETVTWFSHEMEQVPEAVVRSAVFWYLGSTPARMAAMFGVQVSGKWLNPNWASNVATDPIPPDVAIAIQLGNIPTIVSIGSAADVAAISAQFIQAEPKMRVVLEESAPNEPDTVFQVLSTL
jgi:hypothetical protein